MADFEWAIILLLVLAMLVYELVSVRRSIRRAREQDASAPAPRDPER